MISKNQIKSVKQLEHKKHRHAQQLFVAEGPKVVGDLLKCGFEAIQLFATDGWIVEMPSSPRVQYVTDEELRKLSFLQHPQNVLGVFSIPQPKEPEPLIDGLVLALDDIQDPGNLGTIIRIADWFNISTIFCSEDTADAWSPKVVQATMGSIARINIIYTDLRKLIAKSRVPVYGTLLDGKNIYEQELSDKGIIVMGNEGNGISPNIRRLVTDRLLIPQYHEGPESLNVAIATAITCSEFRRRKKS